MIHSFVSMVWLASILTRVWVIWSKCSNVFILETDFPLVSQRLLAVHQNLFLLLLSTQQEYISYLSLQLAVVIWFSSNQWNFGSSTTSMCSSLVFAPLPAGWRQWQSKTMNGKIPLSERNLTNLYPWLTMKRTDRLPTQTPRQDC